MPFQVGPLEVLLFVLLPLALFVGGLARRKGHSFFGYFVFGLVFWPAALAVVLIIDDRRRVRTIGETPVSSQGGS